MNDNSYYGWGRASRGILLSIVLTCFSLSAAFAQTAGTIAGKVTDAKTKDALAGINVLIKGTSLGAATENDGKYTIRNVPEGVYTIVFSAIGYTPVEATDVKVNANEVATVDAALSSRAIPISETIVFGASLRPERVTEAPAAVSVIGLEEIKTQVSHGQLPRLLESQPGVDIVQSGVQDFNINTRGFNKSINRRLLVLLDGRDLAIVLLGVQVWNGLSVPLEDLGKVELVRGPGSALYGANAYNGVISISTPAPKDILGTKISFTGGQLSTFRGDLRHAGLLGDWSYKFNLGGVRTGTWTASRTAADALAGSIHTNPKTGLTEGTFEYPNLPLEQKGYNPNHLASVYGSARLDGEMGDGSVLTFESGITQVENEVFLTGIGRVHVPKARKPWGRAAYSSEHFFAQVWAAGRKAMGPHYSLQSGGELRETSENAHIEFQHRFDALGNQLRVVWGASHRYQHENTEATLIPSPRWDNWSGVFGQAEYNFTDEVKGVVASRFDRSTLHKSQLSPKAAIVWTPYADHSFRLTVNRAFQVPNYSELFLRVDAAAPTTSPRQLEAGLEQYFATVKGALGTAVGQLNLPTNLPWNFSSSTRILAIGNKDLDVEKVTGVELGYKGVVENKLFVTVDAYWNTLTDFVTALLPNVNPTYPKYSLTDGGTNILKNLSDLEALYNQLNLPADHPLRVPIAQLRAGYIGLNAQLGPLLATLENGERAGVYSYTNAGEVRELGLELGGRYYLTDEISVDANYAYFDFDVKSQQLGDVLLPNTPKHKFNVGLFYSSRAGYNASLTAKWVDKYQWAGGIFQGDIPQYTVVNISAGYQLTKNVRLEGSVYNLLNRKHYEIFGGSVLERRALATLTTTF